MHAARSPARIRKADIACATLLSVAMFMGVRAIYSLDGSAYVYMALGLLVVAVVISLRWVRR